MSSKKAATALLTVTLAFAATPAFALPAHGFGPGAGMLSGLARLWVDGWDAVVERFTPEPRMNVAFDKNGPGMDPQGEPGTTSTEPTDPTTTDGE